MVINKGLTGGLARAYLATHQGPHGDAPAADTALTMPMNVSGQMVSPALLAAQPQIGHQRSTGDTKVAVYSTDDSTGVDALCAGAAPRRFGRSGLFAAGREIASRLHASWPELTESRNSAPDRSVLQPGGGAPR